MKAWAAAVLLLTAGALVGRVRAHADDSDAKLYTVVARHMVADGTWFELRYLPTVHPKFREHLPFGLWPSAVVVRTVGEAGLPWLAAWWTWWTVALVMELGRRLHGPLLGVLAGFFLFTTEQFLFYGGLHRLDASLVFFALLAAAPVLAGTRSARAFGLALAAGAVACAIKGPFGLVPLVAAACARAVVEKQWRWLTWGASVTVLSAVPVAVFLLVDRAHGGDWWSGYAEAQLLASAQGTRTDGDGRWTPLLSVITRYWPWLPLLAFGAWRARSESGPARLLVLASVFGLGCLMVPSRKLVHHVLVLFPLLSLVVAAAVVVPVQRWLEGGAARKVVLLGGAVVGVLTVFISNFDLMPHGRAVSCVEFQEQLRALPRGSEVLVSPRAWREISTLAAELQLTPVMVDALPEAGDARMAVVSVQSGLTASGAWHEVGAARGWRLLAR